MNDMENNADMQQTLLKYLDSLELESKVTKVINDSNRLQFEEVIAVLN